MTPSVQLGIQDLPNLDTVQGCDARAADGGSSAGAAANDLKFPAPSRSSGCGCSTGCCRWRSVYIEPKVYRLRGALRVDALQAALDELVERHESLRTRFGFEESGPVQVIAAQLRLELAGGRSDGAGGGRARGRGAAAGAGGGADAVRSGARAAAARAAAARARAGALAAADAAPHHHRRLVLGGACARALGALRGALSGGGERVAGAAGAVRRLCGVAAGVVAGRGAGAAARVLEAGAGGVAGARVADGPAAAGDGQLPRRRIHVRARSRARAGAAQVGSARGRDAVHDAARGVSGVAVPLQRAGRRRGGRADCRSHAPRARGV